VIGLQLKDVPGPTDARTHIVSSVVHVISAVPGGPADNAGLKAGDIIFALNGNPVKDTDDVVSGIFVLKPGTYARVSYIRDGKDGMADVIVGDGSRPFAGPAPR
jgi:S1-C subfamily serine protease